MLASPHSLIYSLRWWTFFVHLVVVTLCFQPRARITFTWCQFDFPCFHSMHVSACIGVEWSYGIRRMEHFFKHFSHKHDALAWIWMTHYAVWVVSVFGLHIFPFVVTNMAQMLSIYTYACSWYGELSCCSWHFKQSHKMTKQKIHVDEFAGKLCVATNHQVFSSYSHLLHHVDVLRSGQVNLCALIFLSANNISQCFRIVAHLIATTCAIDMNEQKHSASKSGPYAVFAVPVSIRMCRNIFKSTYPSVSELGSECFSLKRTGNLSKQYWSEADIKNTYER